MDRHRTYPFFVALLVGLLACADDEPAPTATQAGRSELQLAPGWVEGTGWPSETAVALSNLQLQKNVVVHGDVAVVTSHAGPYLGHAEEAIVGTGAELHGNVRADSLRVANGGQVFGNATYNQVVGGGVVTGTRTTTLALPLAITVPTVPDFVAGTTAVNVAASTVVTLAAGSYGEMVLHAGTNAQKTTLKLSGGVYTFAAVNLHDHSQLLCAAACEIRIKGRLDPGSRTYIGPLAGSNLGPANVQVFVEGANGGDGSATATPYAAQIGADSDLVAYVFAPNGTLRAKSGSTTVGKLVARHIILAERAQLQNGSGTIVLPDPWVYGPRWPEHAVTVLNSLDLNNSAVIAGSAAVITRAMVSTLVTGFEANIGQQARVDGTLQADSVRVRDGANVYGVVSYNELTNNNGSIGGQITPLTLPLPIHVPGFPAFNAGTTLIDVPATTDLWLQPGSYGLVRLRAGIANDKTVLFLSGGIYEIADIDFASYAHIECAAACELRIKNRITLGSHAYIGPTYSAGIDISAVRVFVEGRNGGAAAPTSTPPAVSIGQNTWINAFMFVPNGTLDVKSASNLHGRFVARDMRLASTAAVTKNGTTILPPVIVTQPTNVSVVVGTPATFAVVATGTDISFQWQRDGVAISGANDGTYTLPSPALSDHGSTYRVIVSNAADSVTSTSASLTVTVVAPTIATEPSDVTITEGHAASFTCVASGTNPVYAWQKDGAPISGATETTLTFAAARAQDAGTYTCTATNAAGTATSRAATLTVVAGVPLIVRQPEDLQVSIGAGASFSIDAVGGTLSYRWQRNGVDVAGANGATFSITTTVFADSGAAFRCFVRNAQGEVGSVEAHLTIVDDRPVMLRVDGAAQRSTESDRVTLTGTATAGGSGGVVVDVTSSRYPGTFQASIDGDGAFSIEVPIALGANTLVVSARDQAQHVSQQSVQVTMTTPLTPVVRIVSPIDGATVNVDKIDVRGTVLTTLSPPEVRLELGGNVVFPTGTNGSYEFVFEDVALRAGANHLTVAATTRLGSIAREVTVRYEAAPPVDQGTPPRIRISGAAVHQHVASAALPVQGTVEADTCVDEITVNGGAAAVTGSGTRVSFAASIDLIDQSTTEIVVRAVDCAARHSELRYQVTRDATAPALSLVGLTPEPAINVITTTPQRVHGLVIEPNLAGLTLNGRNVTALPANDANTWAFVADIELVRGEERTLGVEAWDLAGNHTTQRAILRLDSTLDIEVIAPRPAAEIVMGPGWTGVEVVVRAPGAALSDVITARVDAGVPVVLARATTTATAMVMASSGGHQLTIEVRSGGTLLASRVVPFTVVDPAQAPLVLVRQEPANGVVGVEANAFIAFHFNRPIDPARLSVHVFESAHGLTYPEQTEEQTLLNMSDIRLVEVHRDRAAVEGGLSIVPEGTVAGFYPRRDFAFGGTVFVEVDYDGTELARSSFAVRPLPTFMQGFVSNQFGTMLPGISISIPELDLTATTDERGAYGFGFGLPAERTIPGGRYRAVVNPGLADRRYGTAEIFLGADSGRLRTLPPALITELNAQEPFRHVASGDSAELADGELTLDLTNARLTFADGLPHGGVHAQFLTLPQLGSHLSGDYLPDWVFGLQPQGITVTGSVGVTLHLPLRTGSYAYVEMMSDHVLLVARDQQSLLLVPIGVGRVDRNANTVVSVRPIALERLDYIGFAQVMPEQAPLLAKHVAGELTFEQLLSQLEAAQ